MLSLQDVASDAIDKVEDLRESAGLDNGEDAILEDISLEISAERTDSGMEFHASITEAGSVVSLFDFSCAGTVACEAVRISSPILARASSEDTFLNVLIVMINNEYFPRQNEERC